MDFPQPKVEIQNLSTSLSFCEDKHYFLPIKLVPNQLKGKKIPKYEVISDKESLSLSDQLNLVDIALLIPSIQIDLKYAREDNFTGEIVYDFSTCFLIKEAALRLFDVQKELESMGLGLKVWDGLRPMQAQEKFWQLLPDERYVSNPKKGGRHTRGTAVDLTLITQEGVELVMPSFFDDFSERAHQEYTGASEEAIKNRDFLRSIMEKHGFKGLASEWWHFDLVGWEEYPPILTF